MDNKNLIRYVYGGVTIISLVTLTYLLSNVSLMNNKGEKKKEPPLTSKEKDLLSKASEIPLYDEPVLLSSTSSPLTTRVKKESENIETKEEIKEVIDEKEMTNNEKTPPVIHLSKEQEEYAASSEFSKNGQIAFSNNSYEEAIDLYTKALKLLPSSQDFKDSRKVLLNNRAAAYEKLSKYPQVIQDCQDGLTLEPLYTKLLVKLARSNQNINNLDQALFYYTVVETLCQFRNEESKYGNEMSEILNHLIKNEVDKEWKDKVGASSSSSKRGLPKKYFLNFYFNSFQGFTLNKEFNKVLSLYILFIYLFLSNSHSFIHLLEI